jgi:hypothetical protein
MALGEERQVVPLRCELWEPRGEYLDFNRLERKPTAPSDAKLPPLKEPLFFSWKFADGERLFVLAKEGKGFVLYVDTDGDNDLTDEQPFRCSGRSIRWQGWRPYFPRQVRFGPIPIRLRFNDQTITRRFGVVAVAFRDGVPNFGVFDEHQPILALYSAELWRGTMLWEGKPMTVVVMDTDCDGLIGERDQIGFFERKSFRFSVGLPPIGQIGIKERFFRYHVEPMGKELVIEPVQVRATSLRFHGEQLQVSMVNEREGWWLEGEGGELKAPIGSFRLGIVNLSRKDAQGRLWTLLAVFPSKQVPKLEILEEGTTLNLEPLHINLRWDEEDDGLKFSLDITTANGMNVGMLWVDRKRPPEPKLRLTAPDGKVVAELPFHYG